MPGELTDGPVLIIGQTPTEAPQPQTMAPYPTAEQMYTANIVQLFLGVLICLANAMVLAAITSRPRLKTSTNLLLGNVSFANLIVGIMLSVANVIDGWYQVSLLKTESALVVLNCFINIATLLALVTNNFVAIRSPDIHMSARNCTKLIFGIWAVVLLLFFCKALVFAFDRLGRDGACYRCFVVFEVVTLIIFTLSTILVFSVAVYLVISRRRTIIHDESRPVPNDQNREYTVMLTAGLLLVVYFVCFLVFILMYIAWLADATIVDAGTAEIVVSLFFVHCFINPLIILCRHPDLARTIKTLLFCSDANPVGDINAPIGGNPGPNYGARAQRPGDMEPPAFIRNQRIPVQIQQQEQPGPDQAPDQSDDHPHRASQLSPEPVHHPHDVSSEQPLNRENNNSTRFKLPALRHAIRPPLGAELAPLSRDAGQSRVTQIQDSTVQSGKKLWRRCSLASPITSV